MITVAAAGTLTLATVVSVAGVALPTSTAAAATADASLTSVNRNTAAVQAEHQQQAAKAEAARARAAAEKAARAKAAAEKAAKAKAAAKAEAAKAAKARAAADAAVTTKAASVTTPSGSPRQIAQRMLGQFGWSSSQFGYLNPLWEHESGWSLTAENPSSGAYGIPQALPGSQMASAGGDWRTNAATQIKWGLTYIQGRYGSPCGAWAHEQADGWY